jgi:hypothetical protein
MDSVPDIHDQLRSFATRARLKSAHGNADNQVLLTVPGPKDPMPMGLIKLLDPASIYSVQSREALRLIDVWLDRIDADQAAGSRAAKVSRNKPRTYGKPGRCNDLYPASADPRIVSGGPVAGDVLKCQLKPVNNNDYTQPFNASDLDRFKAIFPQGVCDYSKPGIGRDSPKPWQSY